MVLSDEVSRWFRKLRPRDKATALEAIYMLRRHGNQLSMPWSRPLGRGLLELRFDCADKAQRITYTFERERRVITLTTFTKQRGSESAEIRRARRALARLRQRRDK